MPKSINVYVALFAVLIALYITTACSSSTAEATGYTAHNGTDKEDDTYVNSDSDSYFPDGVCAEQDLDLELAGVKAMLLVDASSSMGNSLFGEDKWTAARAAVETLVTDPEHDDTWFGLHAFPYNWLGLLPTCETQSKPAIDLAQDSGTDILKWMKNNHPGIVSLTPLLNSLKYYQGANPTLLHDSTTSNYLVLLSDGADNCYVPTGLQNYRKHNLLTGITNDLESVVGIKTIAVGFGDGVSQNELNAIAKNGGSTFDQFVAASDGPALKKAFEEIAKSIRPCKYLLPPPDADWDSTKVNFYFDDVLVERDRTHANGWDWTRSDELEVEFFGLACEQIQNDSVENVNAKFGCPTQTNGNICATSETFLPFPDTAVMILQDFSGSMSGKKWQAATTAITNMLVDDRNSHIDFGFDPFPSGGGCSVSDSPKFTIGGELNRLPIIEWAAQNDPSLFGSTPLHAALERHINRPGELADKDVSGAIVVITDGEDTCYKPQKEIANALYDTVKQLSDYHDIRTFAIGYGDKANAEQLNAIAKAGNTGMDTFMHANSQEELEALFEQISKMVTSCVFNVPNPGAQADYTQVNIYLDGEVVPRDTSQNNGWDWYNGVTKTNVEFSGTFCDKLKRGEVTDVIIEFGCPTVI